ncbi:ArsR/SmtB family transcription factor [Streptomyces sp. NPDC101145]|uniref:ArsR/SmtB family transcription factor n=1 Tax=Streptomyces sp. NPDC101145 TaxID=3366112 RepID=UPI0037F83A8D
MGADDVGVLGEASGEILGQAAATFGLLASSARLRILRVLAQGESDVAHLADRVGGALSTISQHLSALRRCGLVGVRKDGRRRVFFIEDPAVVEVVRLVVEQVARRVEAQTVAAGEGRRGMP